MTPVHVRKLILFIMQRSSKNCMLLVGGIYIVSLEGFAMVIIWLFLTLFLTKAISFSLSMVFSCSRIWAHPCLTLWSFIQHDDVRNENSSQSVYCAGINFNCDTRYGFKLLVFITSHIITRHHEIYCYFLYIKLYKCFNHFNFYFQSASGFIIKYIFLNILICNFVSVNVCNK